MTPRADVTVRLASQRDVAGIVDLESRYFVDNLDAAARARGFISILHSRQWFALAIDSGGMHVAAIAREAAADASRVIGRRVLLQLHVAVVGRAPGREVL